MLSVTEFFADVSREVDGTLDTIIPKADVEPTRLHEAIRWSVFAGGKRIRPAILMATERTFGESSE